MMTPTTGSWPRRGTPHAVAGIQRIDQASIRSRGRDPIEPLDPPSRPTGTAGGHAWGGGYNRSAGSVPTGFFWFAWRTFHPETAGYDPSDLRQTDVG